MKERKRAKAPKAGGEGDSIQEHAQRDEDQEQHEAPESEFGLEDIPADIDSVGRDTEAEHAFVRMLNKRGHVCAVHMKHVCTKLIEGYSFIVDEPTIPILTCEGSPDRCTNAGKKGWRAMPRKQPQVQKPDDALKVWVGMMRLDKPRFESRTDLWFEAIDKAVDLYRRMKSSADHGVRV